jgi:hypothetical protein
MKVLVCGSRRFTDAPMIEKRMAQLPLGTHIITGGAKGADTIAAITASMLGLSCEVIKAEWGKYGRVAGIIRNTKMIEQKPNLVLAFLKNEEPNIGTLNTIQQAEKANIPVEKFMGD